jgi:hypothetical protein
LPEVTTSELIDLIARPNGLRLVELLFLQGEILNPVDETVDVMISATYPETNELEFSLPEKAQLRRGSLKLATFSDATWFPSPQLFELIVGARASGFDLSPANLSDIQADIAREREIAQRQRDAGAFAASCDTALRMAMDVLTKAEGNVHHWHLVLLGMFRHREQLILRDAREEQFFDDRVNAAREYGSALRGSPRQWVWQADILRRSAPQLAGYLPG